MKLCFTINETLLLKSPEGRWEFRWECSVIGQGEEVRGPENSLF